VKIVARPRDKEGVACEQALTLTAALRDASGQALRGTSGQAGGAVSQTYKIKAYVIPQYRTPVAPPGEAVYLNDLDQRKFMKDHVDAGFSRKTREPRPWIFTDVPLPYYSGHCRGMTMPENLKRDQYATIPYTMGKKTFSHGLWVSPCHETVYNIEGAGFTAFAAEAGFYDKFSFVSVLNFEIYVDGKLRTQSGLMKFGDAPRLLVADKLENAREIRLVTRRDDLVNDWYTTATWGDPRFIKGK
jgi:hypothetical protein